MQMWIELICVLLVVIIIAVSYIVKSNKKAEMNRYYETAHKMIKEICLDGAIKNQKQRWNNGMKLMVYLKWKTSSKEGYVFDPERIIRIGRSPAENEICIREPAVSAKHCRIYLYQDKIIVQDLGSANGTWIKRGLKKYRVNGARILLTGDRLIVGNEKIIVTIFYFDLAFL